MSGLSADEQARLATVLQGASYQRLFIWNRPGAPALYKAELIVRRRLDTADPPLVTLDSVTNPTAVIVSGAPNAITVNVFLGKTVTQGLPIGTFIGAMRLSLKADPESDWIVRFPVSVIGTPFQVTP